MTENGVYIYFVVLWLSAGIKKTYLPREFLVRWSQVLSHSYCKVQDEHVPSNTMTPCTHECIAYGSMENLQGSVKLFCLMMGRIQSSTPMPMSDRVIKCVNAIELQEKQGWAFHFANRSNEPYEWTDLVPEDDPDFQISAQSSQECQWKKMNVTFRLQLTNLNLIPNTLLSQHWSIQASKRQIGCTQQGQLQMPWRQRQINTISGKAIK